MGYFMYVCPECRKVFKVQGMIRRLSAVTVMKD